MENTERSKGRDYKYASTIVCENCKYYDKCCKHPEKLKAGSSSELAKFWLIPVEECYEEKEIM